MWRKAKSHKTEAEKWKSMTREATDKAYRHEETIRELRSENRKLKSNPTLANSLSPESVSVATLAAAATLMPSRSKKKSSDSLMFPNHPQTRERVVERDSGSSVSDMLLSGAAGYAIGSMMSDGGSHHSSHDSSPSFSTHGGEFSGGGATHSWSDDSRSSSYDSGSSSYDSGGCDCGGGGDCGGGDCGGGGD